MIDLRAEDSTVAIRAMPDESVDLIILDPPYLVTNEAWDATEVLTERFINHCKRIMKPTASLYCWCGIGEKSQSLIRWFPMFSQFLIFKDLITWKKRRGIGMRKGWLYTREEIMWFVKTKEYTWNKEHQYSKEPNQFTKGFKGHAVKPFKRLTNVWTDIPEYLGAKDIEHYTPKPMEALKRIILAHTNEGDVVFDPFLGSGQVAIACKELNRACIGIDNDVQYITLSEERLRSLWQ